MYGVTGLSIVGAASLPGADPPAGTTQYVSRVDYCLMEGLRKQGSGGSLETQLEGRNGLRMWVRWDIGEDSSARPLIKAEVLNGEYIRIDEGPYPGFSLDYSQFEHFRGGPLNGLRFEVVLLPEDVRLTLDKRSLAVLEPEWIKAQDLIARDRKIPQDEPLPFSLAVPAFTFALTDLCKDLFQFSRPRKEPALPERFTGHMAVRENASAKPVGTLDLSASLDRKEPATRYALTGTYRENKGPRVDVGRVGSLDIQMKTFGDVSLPERFVYEVKAIALGAPRKGLARYHEKKIAVEPTPEDVVESLRRK